MTNLTKEQYEYIEKKVTVTAHEAWKGRPIFGSDILPPMGEGVQVYTDYLETEMSDAVVDPNFVDNDEDMINLVEANYITEVVQKSFVIKRRNKKASERTGIPLSTTAAQAASRVVAKKEDAMLLNGVSFDGGTTYPIEGLFQKAGQTDATTQDFGTAGKAIQATGTGIQKMSSQGVEGPYDWVLYPTQWGQLKASRLSNGKSEWEEVLGMLEGGNIYMSSSMPTDDGLMCASSGRGYYQYALCADLTVEFKERENGDTKGKVFAIGVPVIKEVNAVCTMTGI